MGGVPEKRQALGVEASCNSKGKGKGLGLCLESELPELQAETALQLDKQVFRM
jgi:hypothetical protein